MIYLENKQDRGKSLKVYIVRHGQVLHNALGQYGGVDEDLTELGINQAKELRDKIKNMNFDIIISSPLIRARHTAEIINSKNQEIFFDDRIKERNCGSLTGKPLSETNREEYWNYNTTLKQGTSENIRLFFEIVFNFLDDLKKQEYKTVLIVAHSNK